MSKVLDDMTEAARESNRHEGETPPPDEVSPEMKDEVRGIVESILAEVQGEPGTVRQIAKDISKRVKNRFWPERPMAIKRKKKQMEVDRAAFREQVKEEVRALIEDREG